MRIFVVVFLLSLQSVAEALRHSLCTTSTLSLRGRDLVAVSRGSVLVAVFMPLQCATCHRQMKRLSYMASTLADVRVVVIAPSYEAPVTISRVQNEFPRLVVDRDVDGVWRAYQASNHDQVVFDRCSRVTHVLSHPRSDMTSYRDTLDAIDSARDHAPCGPCQHDAGRSDVYAVTRETPKVRRRHRIETVDAFIKPHASQHQPQQQPRDVHRYEEYRRSSSQPAFTVRANHNHPQPAHNLERQQHAQQMQRQPQYWNRQQNVNLPQPNNYRTSGNVHGGLNENNNPRPPVPSPIFERHRTLQPQNNPQPPRIPASTTPRPIRPDTFTQEHVYGPDEDYEDDLIPTITTTPAVETQIPTPTSFDPLWPTPAPGQFFNSDPRNPRKVVDTRFTKFGEQASENNIPCSAYTDDICFQQQEKLGREGLSKCCKKGIYLTDVCIPGKCSNHTMQLCCFQKFLQARYTCCEDDEQSLGPSSTNDFSMCCYNNFVNEDECCGKEIAANYWRSVHEVCYPNTKVDFSGIKMEVRFNEGVRVVDMNENRVWDYECRNGVNRTQYAYIS